MIFRSKTYIHRSKFTLIELIVALVIVSLLTALAISSLREESPASALNQQTLALEAWCAAIRYSCAEKGVDFSVRFVPEKKIFYACTVEKTDEEFAPVPENGPMLLQFPDRMEVSTVEKSEEEARETEFVEIFRFYPNGGAACINRPVLKCENLARYFDISFLNGQLKNFDGDGSELLPEDEKR